MLLLYADQDHGLLAAAAAMAVGVLCDVTHEGLHRLDADRAELVPLPVQQVERLVRTEFDLKMKNFKMTFSNHIHF